MDEYGVGGGACSHLYGYLGVQSPSRGWNDQKEAECMRMRCKVK